MNIPPHTGMDPARFVLDEGRLLNEGRYEDWLSLFAPDGHYWVPLDGDRQADPLAHASMAYEDLFLLQTRIQRLRSGRAHSLQPGVRSVHVLQPPCIESQEGDGIEVYTPFLYVEVYGDRQTLLAGTWRHRLRRTEAGLRIVSKRVDLVNAHAAHEAIQLFP